jgi:hypothetical protein
MFLISIQLLKCSVNKLKCTQNDDPFENVVFFSQHVFLSLKAQGRQLYKKQQTPTHGIGNGGVACLQLVGHGICIAVCKVLVFLRFQSNSQRDVNRNWLINHPISSPVM